MDLYKREEYLRQIRGFYNDTMIKVITGIRRCGKSSLLQSIIEELKANGINEKDIINIELDKRPYKNITKPKELEKLIDEKILDSDFKYLFLDEIENVKGFETVINSFREEGNISIFITGSNSYLLSGELVTKLTGRYIEIEMRPLTFYEYIDMKKHYGKSVNEDIYLEFEQYIKEGGFPGAIFYDNYEDKMQYTASIISQIFEKDIKKNNKIRNVSIFEVIQNYVINNFGNIISIKHIVDYLKNDVKVNVERKTVKRYLELLENAKIIYPCELFDMKSKQTLKGDKKYYLADVSIYFARNTDNRINYGPVLENIMFNYLRSKNYKLSVGRINGLECDFIARKNFDKYYYIQVTLSIAEKQAEEREYRPFYKIKELYPRYLFTMDHLLQSRDGIYTENLVNFVSNNEELINS